jgi:hypothetical protein
LYLGRAKVHGDVGGARERDGALEEVEGERGGDESEDARGAAGLAHDGDLGFIAAKGVNMLLHPMDWREGRRGKEGEVD